MTEEQAKALATKHGWRDTGHRGYATGWLYLSNWTLHRTEFFRSWRELVEHEGLRTTA